MYKRPYFSTGECKPELLSIIVCCSRAFNAYLTTVETSNGKKSLFFKDPKGIDSIWQEFPEVSTYTTNMYNSEISLCT